MRTHYNWSGFDLDIKISPVARKEWLKDLVTLFCTQRNHTVVQNTDVRETSTAPDIWEGYEICLRYPPKIPCSELEVMAEFDGTFKSVNSLWLQEINSAKGGNRQKKQVNVWKSFLVSHALEFPNASQLIQIMISTAGNTSLERGYTHLQMVASKRRNRVHPDNLEVLFLLATLKIPQKKPNEYNMKSKG